MDGSWKKGAVALAVFAGVAGSAAAHAESVRAVFVNTSGVSIREIYVSSIYSDTWGRDRLGEHVLRGDGSSFATSWMSPGRYDIKLVDTDGDECKLLDMAFYEVRRITIDLSGLLDCEADS